MVAISLLALAGCGGDSSNSPDPRPSGELSGVAFDGLIIGGDVTAYAWDGTKGEVLGQGRTDNLGEYSITLNEVPSQPILLKVTNGRYFEEASGRNVELQSSDALYAVYDYQAGDEVTTSLTYYTTLAAGLAEHMVRTGTPVRQAIVDANRTISDLLGLDIREVTPLEVTQVDNATPEVTNGHLYGFSTAAISQLTAWISEQNGTAVHQPYNSIRFAQAAYSDIRANGRLDGQGLDGIVAQGTVPLNQEIYRHRIAANMLVMANAPENRTGLTAADIVDHAIRFNESNASLWGSADIIPLSDAAPNMSNFSHATGDTVAGEIELRVSVTDTIGIGSVDLYLNGDFHLAGGASSEPRFLVNTTALEDGEHHFRLIATNVAGGVTEHDIVLDVANQGTTISDISPSHAQHIRGTHTFSASISDAFGLDEVRFIVNGATYFPSNLNSPSYDLSLAQFGEGKHTFTVWTRNKSGYETQRSVEFTIDNTAPEISWELKEGAYLERVYEFLADVTDNETVKSAVLYLDGNVLAEFSAFPRIDYMIDTRDFAEGEKSLSLVAVDKAGNTTTETRKVYFDNTPPTVNIVSPVQGDTITSDFYITVDAWDAVGVEEIEILINGAHHSYAPHTDNARTSVRVNTANFSNGPHQIRVIARDGIGRTAEQVITVIFAHEQPSMTIVQNRNSGTDYRLRIRIDNYDPSQTYTVESYQVAGANRGFGSINPDDDGIFSYGGVHFGGSPARPCNGRRTGTAELRIADGYSVSDTLTIPNAVYCGSWFR
ncbi:hypothetical protein CAI21_21900 [Alkalilimnicola ehrlichii]|uniref:Bacterial Ig-like domain-containing protein n=1 Tax=Alkalilimnicola ehrlichii TaxID=351052 RepID=A0A3E0WI37_9GAMM|nr:hypothetical protein CAI21_21900 [Alkalilimnicola ehrlichii]RFA31626.1 hypothetical protein CAL65_22025 [Alkalilimnicola ehrlichii]